MAALSGEKSFREGEPRGDEGGGSEEMDAEASERATRYLQHTRAAYQGAA